MVELDDLRKDTCFENNGVQVGDFLAGLEAKRKENIQLIPTDDDEVKLKLREFGQPITYFGEDKADRRERLTSYIIENSIDLTNKDEEIVDEVEEDEEFYTPGSNELIEARKLITYYSLDRAKERINKLSELSRIDKTEQLINRRKVISKYKSIELVGSQLISTRPISNVTINKTSQNILTGSWSGDIKILNKNLEIIKEFNSEGKVSGLDWSPTDCNIFLSASNELKLFNAESDESIELKGHTNRIVKSKFHPSGKYLASSSFDLTWRLWDVNTQQQLLLQEGHSKEVYCLTFNNDGSLLASGGLDGIGYIWDLRIGKSIMTLDGHIKPIYGIDWRDNGYHLATGSGDGSIKIWDLRLQKEITNIPAHNNLISEVKFFNNLLISSSYDNTIKIFNCDNWISINELKGHSDKVMNVDITDEFIISSGWDRSIKKWEILMS